MSTQQDIYAPGSEIRPPMLNKENYVPWSSRLLRYAKSRPNGKLIHNSIINGPYVRRMIPEPGDANREVTVTETFHVQTDDELTEKELKQIEADDQAIQTNLLGLPEDIYAAVDTCKTTQEIWLRVQQMMKGSDIGIQEKKAKLFNKWERFTFNEGESIESYYHCFLKLINDLKRNKYFPEKIASNLKFLNNLQPEWSRHGQNARNLTGYNDVQNIGNHVIHNAVQNSRVLNIRNQNGLIGVQGNKNQNQIGNGNLVVARAKGNAAGQNGNQIRCYNCRGVADLDEIEEVNANYILMANLPQASTSGTQTDKAPVYDSDGSAEVHENCDDNEIFNKFTQEEQYIELVEPTPDQHQVSQNDNNVISEVTSMEESWETVEQHPVNFEEIRTLYDSLYQNLAIEVEKVNSVNRKLKERLHKIVKDENFPIVNQVDARVQNFEIKFLKEVAKFVGDFKSLANEADASLAKHKALELEIERLLKAVVIQDIMNIMQKESSVNTSGPQTELECTKEPFENCIIKKNNEYAKLWNDWYKKRDECKYDKISYDKAYKDMLQKIERLQAQLGDLKGKSKDTSCVPDTRNPLLQKL
nr:hypothetical protein [Tanacetum cinerariifolium]